MNAGELDKILKPLKSYGGIYFVSDLDNLVISKVPVSVVVFIENHWIGISITQNSVEVMDSLGFCNSATNKDFINFICRQIQTKRFYVSPKVQSDQSEICGIYVAVFLKLKELGFSFESILDIFSSAPKENDVLVRNKFKELNL